MQATKLRLASGIYQHDFAGVMIRAIFIAIVFCISACATTKLPESHAGLQRGGWDNRYFRFNEEFDYYVGFDLQQLHADTGIDYRGKLDFLASHDVNKIRIWLNPSWFGLPGEKQYSTSSVILYPWWVDKKLNKFDIDRWNPRFWERTKDFLAYARDKGFIVEVSLFSVQEPRDFFRNPEISYPFHHQNNLQDFGRSTDRDGRFMNGFYDLNYADNGLLLADYHRAYIDKALDEFASFDHIYYELINESPGEPKWVNRELPHAWMKYWLRYIAENTTSLVTVHSSGYMNLKKNNKKGWTSADYDEVGKRYWDEDYVDGFNFHLYSNDPNAVSMALTGYQQRGRMLICNEGGSFYDIDRSNGYPDLQLKFDRQRFYGEIRHAWAMMTAGGYYSIYYGPVPSLGDESAIEGARAMQALRHIVEMTDFQHMRPVGEDGIEYDALVTAGPAPHWQVIAEQGKNYIAYFWGSKSTNDVAVDLPAGSYEYFWMDTRIRKAPLNTGLAATGSRATVSIPAPNESDWDADAGVVLVIRRR